MFNRRMFVALAVCLVVSASSAFAGGGGGAKKDSTIQVNNNTTSLLYAFVDVDSAKISAAVGAATSVDNLFSQFNALGGKPIATGANASFSVKTGAHKVTVVNIDTKVAVFVDKPVSTVKGQTSVVNVP